MKSIAKSLCGTETEKWLCQSYLAESQAYARYTFYAWKAESEEYFPVQQIFLETAANELRHAKVFLNFLENVPVEVTAGVDAGYLGTTVDNLKLSLKEESVDGYEFYAKAAAVADREGFADIASHFRAIVAVEKSHYDRFERILDHIANGTLWKRNKPVIWKCIVCGYEHVGTEPPQMCNGCDHSYRHYVALEDGFAPADPR